MNKRPGHPDNALTIPHPDFRKTPLFTALVSPAAIADYLFYPAFFIAVFLWVNPPVEYYYPGFWRFVPRDGYTGWFLTDAPIGFGKAGLFIVSFIASSLAKPVSGSLVITGIGFLLNALSGAVMAALGLARVKGFRFIPGMLLLLQFGYLMNPLPEAVSAILGMAALLIYGMAGRFGANIRIAVFLCSACGVLISAVDAFVMYVLLCVAYECVIKKKYGAACIEASAAAILPAAAALLLFPYQEATAAYGRLLPALREAGTFTGLLPLFFWLFFPGIGFLAALKKPGGHALALLGRKIPGTAVIASRCARGGIASGGIAAVAAAVIVFFNHDLPTFARPHARMNYAMLSRQWDRVIDNAEKMPFLSMSDPTIHLIDRALYHRDRLLEDLFRFPQNPNALLPFHLNPRMKSSNPADRFWALFWCAWTYFELGLLNTAEHCALESLSQVYYPPELQLLARIYAAKSMPEAGRTCLAALEQDPVFRPWAAKVIALSDGAQGLSGMPEAADAHDLALKEEMKESESPLLPDLVRENPRNRMAFEYLIATFLIKREVDSVSAHCGGFRELGYRKIPRLVQEALVLSMFLKEKKPEFFGYRLDEGTMASFEGFFSILYKKHGGRPGEAFDDLATEFGNSFYFYFVYGIPGRAKHDG